MSVTPATDDGALEQLCINVIRGLAMDGPQKANSGHTGTAMALAPLAHVLWTRILRHDPSDPDWPDRDRFVLSNGHASILLYSMLYLTGYDLTLDDLKAFRQWGSRTPGHPERRHTAGVEVTTGPLGQGVANGVGFGIAERVLRARFGPELVRPPHVRLLRRRLPGGGHLARGRLARRPPRARPADLRLRRQPHHDRRPDRARLQRRRPRALQRLRLARRRDRRGGQRPRRARGRAPRRDGRRGQALAHRAAQPHRVAVAAPHRHQGGPRRGLRRRGDRGDQGDPGPAARRDLLRPRRGRSTYYRRCIPRGQALRAAWEERFAAVRRRPGRLGGQPGGARRSPAGRPSSRPSRSEPTWPPASRSTPA